MGKLNWETVGVSVGLFLTIGFVFSVIYDLLLPGQTMCQAGIRLLPSFNWISWGSFVLGLIESFLSGIFLALVVVSLYNGFKEKFEPRDRRRCDCSGCFPALGLAWPVQVNAER